MREREFKASEAVRSSRSANALLKRAVNVKSQTSLTILRWKLLAFLAQPHPWFCHNVLVVFPLLRALSQLALVVLCLTLAPVVPCPT